MKLLDKVKDEYAKELHCQDWIELLMEITINQEELDVHDEIAKRYAKAVLERAAENAKAYMATCGDSHQCACMGRCENPYAYVSKQSILNTDLE